MYFLYQIKDQFFKNFVNYFQLTNGNDVPVGDTPAEQELAADAVGLGQNFDNMNSSELLQELKERLDSLKAAESIVGPEAQVLIRFCNKVKSGEIEGLGPEDADFVRLANIALRKLDEYKHLAGEAARIDDAIRVELARLSGDVEKEISNPTGNTVLDTAEIASGYENEQWFTSLSESEKEQYSALVTQRTAVKQEFESKVAELTPEQQEMFGNKEEILTFSETQLDETASFADRVDTLQRDIDRIESNQETLRLQILLLEDPENLAARHELLSGVFNALPEESKEGLIGNTIESLTAGDIYSMKQRGVDLATIFMVTDSGELSTGKASMNSGDMFKVNFGASQSADKIIGAGDIIAIEDVYSVEINGISGTRRFSPRPGYYTESGRYLAIHDGYQVKIGEKREVTPEELASLEAARNERFTMIRTQDISKVISELEGDNPEIPFTAQGDIELLNKALEETGIEGLVYNPETKTIDMPDGMNFGEVKEIMNNYQGVISDLTQFISDNKSKINSISGGQSLDLSEVEHSSLLIEGALRAMAGTSLSDQIEFDANSQILTTSGDLKIEDIIGGSYEYQGNGTRHLRYMPELRNAVRGTSVPLGSLITLIYHENHRWDPTATPGTSSAYGLGQMIDGTWSRYGRGLNRNNPGDQLIATVRYMEAIKERKNCPWEHVLAYYNTGEGINSVSTEKARHYASINPAITAKIPGGIGAVTSPRVYFTGAVAYYNDITYAQARATM